MRWFSRIAVAVGLLTALALAAMAWTYPALAAAVCAGCKGMERVSPTLVVEPVMTAETRAALLASRARASQRVRAFFGMPVAALDDAVLVACATEACDRRMGGRGARATTLTAPVLVAIRLSPRGLDETIVAHELAHVAIHDLVGLERARTGEVPAWFDEGMAVLVSDDTRYVRDGRATRCDEAPLPSKPLDWAVASGRDPTIYADAACRVLGWMARNGGRDGLIEALADGRDLP